MSNKHSVKNRKMWANIPKEERSRRMSEIAKKRMQTLSPRQRKLIGRRLVNARLAKRADGVE